VELIFGTDGWRDIIGERFTFANVARVAQAYAEHLLERQQQAVVVGFDTRFNGELFARRAAEVLAANGLRVLLSKSYLPTPALSFAVTHYGAGGGVMLTASHNPPAYSGFKLKGPYGGTATTDIYQDVSARLASRQQVAEFDSSRHDIEPFDIRRSYYEALMRLVNLEALRSFKGQLVHDAMGGAAAGWLSGFVRSAKLPLEVYEVHAVPNPTFYGVNPEPIPANLESVTAVMQGLGAVFATATDGDGDRLGVVLPGGAYFNSHQIFAVLLRLLHQRGGVGRVIKTFTVSRIIERLAARHGLPCLETPVGFKYIVDAMLQGGVLIGGEESGGIGVAGHLPERDGLANSLLLLEAVATSGRSLAELFTAIERDTEWSHAYDRCDLLLKEGVGEALAAALASPPQIFAGRAVESVETLDGVKINLSGQTWLLFRASGTEPLLRIYCEAPHPEEVKALLAAAQRYVAALTAVFTNTESP